MPYSLAAYPLLCVAGRGETRPNCYSLALRRGSFPSTSPYIHPHYTVATTWRDEIHLFMPHSLAAYPLLCVAGRGGTLPNCFSLAIRRGSFPSACPYILLQYTVAPTWKDETHSLMPLSVAGRGGARRNFFSLALLRGSVHSMFPSLPFPHKTEPHTSVRWLQSINPWTGRRTRQIRKTCTRTDADVPAILHDCIDRTVLLVDPYLVEYCVEDVSYIFVTV
jgi:hypothetical protein